MIEGETPHNDPVNLPLAVLEKIGGDAVADLLEGNGEIIRTHLAREQLVRAVVLGLPSINMHRHVFCINRREERKALDMVPMRVGNEQVQFFGRRLAREQVLAQFPDARAGVANKKGIVKPNFHAGGVAPINPRPARRRRNRTPRSPKLDKGGHLLLVIDKDAVRHLDDIALPQDG